LVDVKRASEIRPTQGVVQLENIDVVEPQPRQAVVKGSGHGAYNIGQIIVVQANLGTDHDAVCVTV